ncbi:MAG: S8 family serine peptidase, partial [Myxococcales bacterium]|nr:S8 family serine peptidase [Myxococcales bacterium]
GPTADGRIKPDVSAPGWQVITVEPMSGQGYIAVNGTSFSTPIAAGVAALLLEADPTKRIQRARNAFLALSRWSGYRDGRFELDEIVRRFVEQGSSAKMPVGPDVISASEDRPTLPTAAPPAVPVRTEVFDEDDLPGSGALLLHPGPAPAATSAPAATPGPPAADDDAAPDEPTAVVRGDDSETDISRPLRTEVMVPPPSPREGGRRGLVVGLGVVGMLLLSVGAMTLFGGENEGAEIATAEQPAPDASPSRGAVEEPSVQEPSVQEPPGADTGGAMAPAEEPPADAGNPVGKSDGDEPADDGELKLIEEPPQDEVEAKEPPKSVAIKTKVSIVLGAGVNWAEVKIGSRTYELDAFESKSASTRLSPGKVSVSYRTKVGAPMNASKLDISEGKATIVVEKSGLSLR